MLLLLGWHGKQLFLLSNTICKATKLCSLFVTPLCFQVVQVFNLMGLIPIFFLFFCEINESNQLLHGSTAGMHSRKKMLVLKEVGVGFFIFYFYLFSVSIILDRVPHSNMPFLQVVGVYLSLLHHFLRLFSCSSSSNCLSATFLERSQKFARSAYNPSKCCWMKHSCSFYMGLWRD